MADYPSEPQEGNQILDEPENEKGPEHTVKALTKTFNNSKW